MNTKVVVLGGGTGMSTLLKGLKQFPIDITAIVSVCDDGKSTGRLREEFNTPAVGDIRKVIVSLAEKDSVFGDVINYRFQTTSDLNGHTVGNLILTALSEITGNLSDAIESISKILKLKGRVLPLTEDCVTLMGKMEDGEIIEGEHNITECPKKIKEVYYKEEPVVCEASLKAIRKADLIILSMGSLYTSILPNLICHDILKELEKSNSKIMYVSNMMTQPGETDNYKVSDHLKILNKYLENRKVDVVIANNSIIDKNILKKYETLEQKDQVILDEENIDIEIIQNDYVNIQDEVIRHKVDKLALDIYAYLIR